MREIREDGKLPDVGRRRVGFLFDVDNTLLDNDAVITDLRVHLRAELGEADADRYWAIFDGLRAELGYADYLGALQGYRSAHPTDLRVLSISRFLVTYPFSSKLFPGGGRVLAECARSGVVSLLSDGDVVFQPWKIESSGLGRAVEGRVLVYAHKEKQLSDVHARLRCDHYVMIDDKLRILAAIKAEWQARVTTVFVRQGHYAHDPSSVALFPEADLSIDRIAQLSQHVAAILGKVSAIGLA